MHGQPPGIEILEPSINLRVGVEPMSALAKGRGTAINRPLDEAATLLFSGFEAEAAEVDRAAGLDARAKVRCSGGAAIISRFPPP